MTRIYKQAQRVLVFVGNPLYNDLQDYYKLFNYIGTKLCRGAGVKCIKRHPGSKKYKSIIYSPSSVPTVVLTHTYKIR